MTPPRDIVDSLEECRKTEKEFQFLVELGNAWPEIRDRLRAAEKALAEAENYISCSDP